MPPDESYFARQLTDLQRQLTEARAAATFDSFAPTNVDRVATLLPIQTGTVGADALRESVLVPAGFTSATLLMTVALDGVRDGSTSGSNTLTVQAFADVEIQDPLTRTFVTAGSQGSVTHSLSATLAGLSGSFDMGALGWGSSGWVANSGTCHLSALVVFMR
jgi:hypothetical protein